jgi:hypothetical protein
VLTGAELNAEIEHASPYGKDPGEKEIGEKKKIGALAEHHYEDQVRAGTLKPALSAANSEVDNDLPKLTEPRPARLSDWILSGLVVVEAAGLAYLKLRGRFKGFRSKLKA